MGTGVAAGQAKDTEETVAEAIEISPSALALSAVDRAAIDSQVATAKEYPRTVSKCLKEALSLATLDEDTAASMFYSMPRDGKMIEGPSARLAEVMLYAWGNFRGDADIVAEDRTHITAMGTAFDLEKNIAVRIRVKRRITKKNGQRYNEDMIAVAGNAAISIALRNAVFKVIPRAMVDRIYQAARQAAVGDLATLSHKREKAIAWFNKAGVANERIFEKLGVKDVDDIGEEEYLTLLGLYNAVKSEEISIDSAFGKENGPSEGATELNDALGLKKSGEQKPPAESKPAAAAKPAKPTATPVVVKGVDCKECGAKVGEPHKSACPLAD